MLNVDDLTCGYQVGQPVLEGMSFQLDAGEIGAILGPSGCGKTTLLKAIAGFQPVHAGSISVHGKRVSSPGNLIPPEKRSIGVVFQDYALFPHLNVFRNIAFGLRHLSSDAQRERVKSLLDLTRLDSVQNAYPHELSGGQQQRVALARALAPNPALILMDEPFSNLDAEMRQELAHEVKTILKTQGVMGLLVTHDQQEAFSMASRVGLIHQGILQQWDTPYRLYHEPQSRFVATFIGRGVFIRGTMLNENQADTALGVLTGKNLCQIPADTTVDVLIRPDDLEFDAVSPVRVRIADRNFAGATMVYKLQLKDGSLIEMVTPSHDNLEQGTETGVRLIADHLIAFSH